LARNELPESLYEKPTSQAIEVAGSPLSASSRTPAAATPRLSGAALKVSVAPRSGTSDLSV
jgi:hypothetical protein